MPMPNYAGARILLLLQVAASCATSPAHVFVIACHRLGIRVLNYYQLVLPNGLILDLMRDAPRRVQEHVVKLSHDVMDYEAMLDHDGEYYEHHHHGHES